jgi:hypothetical protein
MEAEKTASRGIVEMERGEGPNRPGTLAGLAHQALRPEPAAQACEGPVRARS